MSQHLIASEDDANARAHDQSWIRWAMNAPASNTYTGTNGDDNFLGTEGADTFIGLKGDDIYRIDNSGDKIIEEAASGYDTVIATIDYTLPAQLSIELLRVARSAQYLNVNLTGNELSQTIEGKSGNNILNGGGGADILKGFAGDDTYFVDMPADLVIEAVGEGNDTVIASSSYTLGKGQEIETLRLAATSGNRSVNLVGNEFDQTLIGNDRSNKLDGGGGADLMIGGMGNDVYVVDNGGDRIIETIGGGSDSVETKISYKLVAKQEIETLRAADSVNKQSINLYGNEFNQSLQGNAGNNTLDGKGGADILYGFGGNDIYVIDHARDRVYENQGNGNDTVITTVSWRLDARQEVEVIRVAKWADDKGVSLTGNDFGQTLIGGGGADILDGGYGSDTLTGGAGADTFVFGNSLSKRNVDRITDFSEQDSIRLVEAVFPALELGQLDSYAFKNISTGKVDENDRILYNQSTGELFYDADGSQSGAAIKFCVIDNKAALTAADVFVV